MNLCVGVDTNCEGEIDLLSKAQSAFEPMKPQNETRASDLSLFQKQWWHWAGILENGVIDATEMLIPVIMSIPDRSNLEIAAALSRTLEKHAMLRARFFMDDGALQREIEPANSFPILFEDISHDDYSLQSEEVAARVHALRSRPLPATGRQLTRLNVLKVDSQTSLIIVVMNHQIADAQSGRILQTEICRQLGLPFNRIFSDTNAPSYEDYERWESSWLCKHGDVVQDYWRSAMRDMKSLCAPQSGKPLTWANGTVSRYRIVLPSRTSVKIDAIAKVAAATPFIVHAAILASAVHEWSGRDQFLMRCFGDFRARHPKLFSTIGLFVVGDTVIAEVEAGNLEGTIRNIARNYWNAVSVRLPCLPAYPPNFPFPGKKDAEITSPISISMNYMPAWSASKAREKSTSTDALSSAELLKIEHLGVEKRAYSVSPINFTVKHGASRTEVVFLLHNSLLSPDEQGLLLSVYSDLIAQFSNDFG